MSKRRNRPATLGTGQGILIELYGDSRGNFALVVRDIASNIGLLPGTFGPEMARVGFNFVRISVRTC